MYFGARYLWLSRFGFAMHRLHLGEEPFRRMLESFGSVSGIQEGRGSGNSTSLSWKNTISKIFPPRAPSSLRAKAPNYGARPPICMNLSSLKLFYRRDREHFRGVPVSKTIEDAGQAAICRVSPESHGLHSSIGFPVATFGCWREWPHPSLENLPTGL